MFTLNINTDNDAFHDTDGNAAPEMEIARILREAADNIEIYLDHNMNLTDFNGSKVGTATYR